MPKSAILAVAMLITGAAAAQAPTPAAGTGARTSGNGTQSTSLAQGASPTRANGAAPASTTSGTPGTNNVPGSGTGGGTPGQPSGDAANAAPAPLGNGKVEIIGRPSMQRRPSEDKPLLPMASLANAVGIPSGTPLRVRLTKSVDSGHARNGDMLDGILTEPAGKLKAGTPVRLTVVQASRAGAMLSYGELSLQVVAVGPHNLLSETISAQGMEGKKEQADAAPARGTEAVFTSDQVITLPAA